MCENELKCKSPKVLVKNAEPLLWIWYIHGLEGNCVFLNSPLFWESWFPYLCYWEVVEPQMVLTETSLSRWGYGVRGSVMVRAVEGAGLMLLFSLLPCLHHCAAFSVKSASITFSLESHKLSNPYSFHKWNTKHPL